VKILTRALLLLMGGAPAAVTADTWVVVTWGRIKAEYRR
jgi:hypothetical protein